MTAETVHMKKAVHTCRFVYNYLLQTNPRVSNIKSRSQVGLGRCFDVIDYINSAINVICIDALQGGSKMTAPSQTSSMDSTKQDEVKKKTHLQ